MGTELQAAFLELEEKAEAFAAKAEGISESYFDYGTLKGDLTRLGLTLKALKRHADSAEQGHLPGSAVVHS